jgi:hypothetical protein
VLIDIFAVLQFAASYSVTVYLLLKMAAYWLAAAI